MNKESLTFEQSVDELEKIVNAMENNDLPLNELLEQFENGIHLLRICEETLAKAEAKIEVLTKEEIAKTAVEEKTKEDENEEGFGDNSFDNYDSSFDDLIPPDENTLF